MPGRSLGSSLGAGGLAWRSTAVLSGLQRRCFSCSSQRQALQPVSFPQTSSQKLDQILETIRQDIILPSYLPSVQRHKVYSKKYKNKLDNDPITLEIDGETVRFRHTDLFSTPNTTKIFKEALENMKTVDDFRLIPKLLEGLCVHARRKLHTQEFVRVIRKTDLNDCFFVTLECIMAAKRTGFRLVNSEIVNSVLTTIQKNAVEADYERAATEKALGWTERIVELLEDDVHTPTNRERPTWEPGQGMPLNRDPQVLCARLHMAAALALNHNDGQDVDGKVAKYAQEIANVWPPGVGLVGLQGPSAFKSENRLRYLQHPNQLLFYGSPVMAGLELAAQVLRESNEPLASRMKELGAAVRNDLQSAADTAVAQGKHEAKASGEDGVEQMRPTRGYYMYQKLVVPPEGLGGAEQSKQQDAAI